MTTGSKDLTETLRKMLGHTQYDRLSSRADNSLPAPAPKSQTPGRTGTAVVDESKGGTGTAGFSETDYNAREYHPLQFKSSDGLFTLPAIKKIKGEDGTWLEFLGPT